MVGDIMLNEIQFKCPRCGYAYGHERIKEDGNIYCVYCDEEFKADVNTFSAKKTIDDMFNVIEENFALLLAIIILGGAGLFAFFFNMCCILFGW